MRMRRDLMAMRLRRASPPIAALFVMVVLAVILFKGLWLDRTGTVAGSGEDPDLFVWYMAWTPWAIGHLHNPLFTDYLLAPGGVNLMWNTSIVLPSFLLWPVTALAGPIWSYDVLATLAPAVSGWAAYLVLRRYTSWTGALAGGLLYGFSPEIVSQSRGHVMVTLAVFPPVAWFLLEKILRATSRRTRLVAGSALGAASVAQLLTGAELLVITIVASTAAVAVLGLMHLHEVPRRAAAAAEGIAAAAVVGAVLGAAPIGIALFGPQHVTGAVQAQDVFVQDVATLFVPTRALSFVPDAAARIASHVTGDAVEAAGYLGVPLVLAVAAIVFLRRRDESVRWAIATTAVVVLLALGPHLHVEGRVLRIPLPWRLIEQLPIVASVLPARLMVIAYLPLGLIIAKGVDAVLEQRNRVAFAGLGVAAAAAVALSLLPSAIPVENPVTPVFFSHGVSALRPGRIAIVSPETIDFSAMRYQAVSNMRFAMTGGGAFTPGPVFGPRSSPLTDELRAAESSPDWSLPPAQRLAAVRAEVATLDIEAVIVAPQPHEDQVVALMTAVLGSAPDSVEGVELWLRPSGLSG